MADLAFLLTIAAGFGSLVYVVKSLAKTVKS